MNDEMNPKADIRNTSDALQRRLSHFIRDVPQAFSTRGFGAVRVGTDLGCVRKKNEDRVLVSIATYAANPEKNFVLAALCDGMGGMEGGADAATLALSTFASRVIRSPRKAPRERLIEAAHEANSAVYARWGGRGGATLSAVMIDGQSRAFAVNIGDSRVYVVTDTRELIQISKDDTLAGVLGQSIPGPHMSRLVQFVGMGEELEPNFIPAEGVRFSEWLLTTDGVHNSHRDTMAQVTRNSESPSELVERLLGLGRNTGGRDNASAIVVPSRPDYSLVESDQGLNLKFIGPSDAFEIWIPILAEGNQEPLPVALTEAHDRTSNRGAPKLAQTSQQRNKRRRSKKAMDGRSEAGRDETSDRLPLEDEKPALNITFPEKE